MKFDAKMKDGAINELRQQVQEGKKCALNRETAQTKQVEKCALMQFERDEVIQLNNIIEQHENTIKCLQEKLEEKYDGGSAIIKKLLQEKFRYTAVAPGRVIRGEDLPGIPRGEFSQRCTII